MMMNNKTIISLSFFFFLWVIPRVHSMVGIWEISASGSRSYSGKCREQLREFMNMKKLGLISKVCKMFFQVSNFSETSKKFSNNS